MSLGCGEAVEVRNAWNTTTVRFVAQCGGRFLVISNNAQPVNGLMLHDWRAVVRQLVALAVPHSLQHMGQQARSLAGGLYHDLMLTYPLSAAGLAALIGEDDGSVRDLLADLAVQAE